MAVSSNKDGLNRPVGPPATTPEAREKQLQALAYDLAEQQLRDGTASSQLITTILKSATMRDALEKAKISQEVELLKSRAEQISANSRSDEVYQEALNAFKSYSGNDVEMPDEY